MSVWKKENPHLSALQAPCLRLLLFGNCPGCVRDHDAPVPSRAVLAAAVGGADNLLPHVSAA
jgi:hypothetical protein